MTNKEASNVLRLFANLIEINGLPEERILTFRKAYEQAITELESDKRPQGECRTCRHRDPEDKKCDYGGQERQGCLFPVNDDYFCKFYEEGGADK